MPGLKELLLQSEDGESHLIFPDLSFSEMQAFIEHIYDGVKGQQLTLDMSQDVYSVLFGFSKSDDTSNNMENKEKMVEIVVENHEAINGMQQFELIIPETDNLNFTPIKIDDAYETSSKSYYVSMGKTFLQLWTKNGKNSAHCLHFTVTFSER